MLLVRVTNVWFVCISNTPLSITKLRGGSPVEHLGYTTSNGTSSTKLTEIFLWMRGFVIVGHRELP